MELGTVIWGYLKISHGNSDRKIRSVLNWSIHCNKVQMCVTGWKNLPSVSTPAGMRFGGVMNSAKTPGIMFVQDYETLILRQDDMTWEIVSIYTQSSFKRPCVVS